MFSNSSPVRMEITFSKILTVFIIFIKFYTDTFLQVEHFYHLYFLLNFIYITRDEARKKASDETANQKLIWLNKYL